ncbi:hypothetical protein GCM10007916_28590 [Psychromonas marina]|uniref:Uncharacterized protein n=1 Tax=Psychromonas marina TaxID=88364 RepID=A0ABQ6E2X9_9GAMM|nr:hypothetical protein GCM10007916_28590 [Psychromonas marina]
MQHINFSVVRILFFFTKNTKRTMKEITQHLLLYSGIGGDVNYTINYMINNRLLVKVPIYIRNSMLIDNQYRLNAHLRRYL